MPLTARKVTHLTGKYASIMAGRSQTVNLTLRNADGTTSVLAVPAVWKPVWDSDPTRDGATVHPAEIGTANDIVAWFRTTDVTLVQLRSCIYASPASPGPGETSPRYTLVSIEARGIPPGGDRFVTEWVRE